MTSGEITAAQVREALCEWLAENEGEEAAAALAASEGADLLADGLIDSFGLLELLGFLEERFGVDIDFDVPDGDRLTEVDRLARHVAALAEAVPSP